MSSAICQNLKQALFSLLYQASFVGVLGYFKVDLKILRSGENWQIYLSSLENNWRGDIVNRLKFEH